MEQEHIEIKINEYVRFRDGVLAICVNIRPDDNYDDITWYEFESNLGIRELAGLSELDKNISKHSFKIEDLIEQGDIINGKEVATILTTNGMRSFFFTNNGAAKCDSTRIIDRGLPIKTIITREQAYERTFFVK